ncbi:MAG: FxLYD domain-containing protein [Anaerolineae bacterium]|nr:FxLYD domain-containing protein [Anaerolineae bacterium]
MLRSYILRLSEARSLKYVQAKSPYPAYPLFGLLIVLVLATLACNWIELGAPAKAKRVVIRINLPTLTPTPRPSPTVNLPRSSPSPVSPPSSSSAVTAPPTVTLAPLPTTTFTPAATDTYNQEQALAPPIPVTAPTDPVPTSPPPTSPPVTAPTTTSVPNPSFAPTPTVTPIPETPGWAFAKIRTYNDEYEGGLILYGELVNDTGAPQEIAYITGAFYDPQGQIIADSDSTTEYWPLEIVPPGGRTPFELAVNGIQAAANFKLWANSTTTSQSPRQDFNFEGVEQWSAAEDYCLTGQLQNPGGELHDFLVIAAVLYDSQGNVVNFGETYESALEGGETLDFEICIEPPNQNAARHELYAWGQ